MYTPLGLQRTCGKRGKINKGGIFLKLFEQDAQSFLLRVFDVGASLAFRGQPHPKYFDSVLVVVGWNKIIADPYC